MIKHTNVLKKKKNRYYKYSETKIYLLKAYKLHISNLMPLTTLIFPS